VIEPPPSASGDLSAFFQQWKTLAVSVIGIGVFRGIRMFLASQKDPDTVGERKERQEAAQWLSRQDRRFRDAVDRTDADNQKFRDRIDALEAEIIKKDAEIERERQSGTAHYLKTIRIYAYVSNLVHDWRNGQPPPVAVTKIEDL
jgi:hypothetical protein